MKRDWFEVLGHGMDAVELALVHGFWFDGFWFVGRGGLRMWKYGKLWSGLFELIGGLKLGSCKQFESSIDGRLSGCVLKW